jgi:P-type E1-E2 ATPase
MVVKRCKNSDLIEELGQIQIIFCDKTGTITSNKMVLKKFQINGIKYGDEQDYENDFNYAHDKYSDRLPERCINEIHNTIRAED